MALYLSRAEPASFYLHIETGRWTFPKTRLIDRVCRYCNDAPIDSELHFITECDLTIGNRESFFSILGIIDKNFGRLSNEDKLKYIFCHVDTTRVKLSNKYLELLVKTRKYFDQGKNISDIEIISPSNVKPLDDT